MDFMRTILIQPFNFIQLTNLFFNFAKTNFLFEIELDYVAYLENSLVSR